MKIRIKLSIFTIFLVLSVAGSISIFTFFAEKRLLIAEVKETQAKIITSLAQISKESLIIGDNLIVINYLNFIKRTNTSIMYAYVTDGKGEIIAHTDASFIGDYDKQIGFEERDAQGITERSFYLNENILKMRPFLGNVEPGEQVYELSLAGWRKGERVVTAKIGFLQSAIEKTVSDTLEKTRKVIFFIAFITILLGIFLSFIVAYTLSRPIKALEHAIKNLGEGKLDTEINVKTDDELGILAREFNNMSRRLKELDKMKDDFVSNVTHELRSPLGAIESYVNLMIEQDIYNGINEGVKSSDRIDLFERHEHLRRIKNNTTRLSRFINDLLDISKIEAGRMQLNKENTDIVRLIEDLVSLFELQARDKNVDIKLDLDPLVDVLYIDEDKIRQVLTNLLNNAIKFSNDGGDILIKTKVLCTNNVRNKEHVHSIEFSVSDTGVGISKENLARVFDKFEQVLSRAKNVKVPKGTGLGLSIVKGIVEAHGGRVWVESELGVGSTFYFVIPAILMSDKKNNIIGGQVGV